MPQVTTCSNGKYKINAENVFISLPVELGADGVKRIIEIEINEEEQAKVSRRVGRKILRFLRNFGKSSFTNLTV